MSVDLIQRVTVFVSTEGRVPSLANLVCQSSERGPTAARFRCFRILTESSVVHQEQNRPQVLLRLHQLSWLRLQRLLGAYPWFTVNRCLAATVNANSSSVCGATAK